MPSKTDVKSTFTLAGETVIGKVKIEKCFPRPLCTCTFKGVNISEFMTTMYTNASIFFDTHIEIKYKTDICEGYVNVTCIFGDSFLHFNEHVRDCSGKLRLLEIDSFASYNREEGGEGENRSNGHSDEIEPMSKQLTAQTTCDSGIGLSTPACNKEELLRATESEEAEDLMEEC